MTDMLDKAAVSELDQCAVRFRQLSSFGATLSEKVASVWCGTCGLFYRNLSKLQQKDPSKILIVQETFVELFGKERLSAELKANSQMKLEEVKQTNATASEEVHQKKEARQWIPSAAITGSYRVSSGDGVPHYRIGVSDDDYTACFRMFCGCKYLQNDSESISEHLVFKKFPGGGGGGGGGIPPDPPIGGCAKGTPSKATPYCILPPQTPNHMNPCINVYLLCSRSSCMLFLPAALWRKIAPTISG